MVTRLLKKTMPIEEQVHNHFNQQGYPLFVYIFAPPYSRGYKNRAIVKKMFKISPIFNGGIECQLFKFMTFFNSMKDLTCMVGPFFSQSVHVGRHRRP